jgi:hypothetical protein
LFKRDEACPTLEEAVTSCEITCLADGSVCKSLEKNGCFEATCAPDFASICKVAFSPACLIEDCVEVETAWINNCIGNFENVAEGNEICITDKEAQLACKACEAETSTCEVEEDIENECSRPTCAPIVMVEEQVESPDDLPVASVIVEEPVEENEENGCFTTEQLTIAKVACVCKDNETCDMIEEPDNKCFRPTCVPIVMVEDPVEAPVDPPIAPVIDEEPVEAPVDPPIAPVIVDESVEKPVEEIEESGCFTAEQLTIAKVACVCKDTETCDMIEDTDNACFRPTCVTIAIIVAPFDDVCFASDLLAQDACECDDETSTCEVSKNLKNGCFRPKCVPIIFVEAPVKIPIAPACETDGSFLTEEDARAACADNCTGFDTCSDVVLKDDADLCFLAPICSGPVCEAEDTFASFESACDGKCDGCSAIKDKVTGCFSNPSCPRKCAEGSFVNRKSACEAKSCEDKTECATEQFDNGCHIAECKAVEVTDEVTTDKVDEVTETGGPKDKADEVTNKGTTVNIVESKNEVEKKEELFVCEFLTQEKACEEEQCGGDAPVCSAVARGANNCLTATCEAAAIAGGTAIIDFAEFDSQSENQGNNLVSEDTDEIVGAAEEDTPSEPEGGETSTADIETSRTDTKFSPGLEPPSLAEENNGNGSNEFDSKSMPIIATSVAALVAVVVAVGLVARKRSRNRKGRDIEAESQGEMFRSQVPGGAFRDNENGPRPDQKVSFFNSTPTPSSSSSSDNGSSSLDYSSDNAESISNRTGLAAQANNLSRSFSAPGIDNDPIRFTLSDFDSRNQSFATIEREVESQARESYATSASDYSD